MSLSILILTKNITLSNAENKNKLFKIMYHHCETTLHLLLISKSIEFPVTRHIKSRI